MSQHDRKRATYEDLVALPENILGQIIDGELIALAHRGSLHAFALAEVRGRIAYGLRDTSAWELLSKPEVHFGKDVLVPDIAAWRTATFPGCDGPYLTVAPDWLCEILTPSTAALARDRKLPVYARAKVKHAWLLDLEARTLEVFRLRGAAWEPAGTFRADALVRAEPFDAIELDLSRLWV